MGKDEEDISLIISRGDSGGGRMRRISQGGWEVTLLFLQY